MLTGSNFMSGFVTFHREATEHPLFKGEPARLGAWFWLVAKACWKPTKFDIQGKIVTLNRGQVAVSRSQLAKAWGMSESGVERFLTRLQTEQMIERATGQGRSVITICNYSKYQDQESKAGQATGQATGQRSDSRRTAKEQGNKEPNGSIVISARRDADWPEIPDWIPAASWNGWLEVRERKRDWPTPRAIELAIKNLIVWRTRGHDPGSILDKSTLNNWTGIFKPKENRDANRNRQTSGFTPSGDRRSGPTPDGFSAAIDDALDRSRPGNPAEAAGRHDVGAGDGTLGLPAPGAADL
jgi:hypothetical protein